MKERGIDNSEDLEDDEEDENSGGDLSEDESEENEKKINKGEKAKEQAKSNIGKMKNLVDTDLFNKLKIGEAFGKEGLKNELEKCNNLLNEK